MASDREAPEGGAQISGTNTTVGVTGFTLGGGHSALWRLTFWRAFASTPCRRR
jgi:hypothetical protein